jgi:hypothetical protein
MPPGISVDNRDANIGQQVVVHGDATIGPMTFDLRRTGPERVPPGPYRPPPEDKRTSSPAAARRAILLCTANAVDPDQRLRLEEELRAIDDALRRSRVRDAYEPRMCPAVTFTKVIHEIDDHEPTFLHFGGHGDPSGRLVLLGERDDEHHVAPEHLAELLGALHTPPTLVTFATCYSHELARAAARHAAFAIGFEGPLDDESAPLFSATLYERLAARAEPDVPRAFRLARLACLAAGQQSVELARLFERPGREVVTATN